MLRHFITTINYDKLIEMQANQPLAEISKSKSNSFSPKTNNKGKCKKHSIYNSVKRHH